MTKERRSYTTTTTNYRRVYIYKHEARILILEGALDTYLGTDGFDLLATHRNSMGTAFLGGSNNCTDGMHGMDGWMRMIPCGMRLNGWRMGK